MMAQRANLDEFIETGDRSGITGPWVFGVDSTGMFSRGGAARNGPLFGIHDLKRLTGCKPPIPSEETSDKDADRDNVLDPRQVHAGLFGSRTRHKRTRPYRPQTNGKVERYHRILAREWA